MSARAARSRLRAGAGAARDAISASWATSCTFRSSTRSYLYEELWSAGEALRHRQRRLSRRQQPAPREALSGLGLRHHAGLQSVRGGPRLLRGARTRASSLARAALAARQGERAAAEARRGSPRRREVNMFGGEIVLAGGRVLGRVTSGGYGYTVGRNILCAYVAADEPAHAAYEVEVMGVRYPAVRHTRPLYDPDRKRDSRLNRLRGTLTMSTPSRPPAPISTPSSIRARRPRHAARVLPRPRRCMRRSWRGSGTAAGSSPGSRSRSRSPATS